MSEEREEQLCQIIRDTLWMARRYADGRNTYAPGMYNDAAQKALDLGVIGPENFGHEQTIWAGDPILRATPTPHKED